MIRAIRHVAVATALALMLTGGTATAQKTGGVLRVHLWDSPPHLSMIDGVNPLAARTLMPMFNNLVMFDQHVKQSRLDAIVPIWRPLGPGTRTAPKSPFGCATTSNAPGI